MAIAGVCADGVAEGALTTSLGSLLISDASFRGGRSLEQASAYRDNATSSLLCACMGSCSTLEQLGQGRDQPVGGERLGQEGRALVRRVRHGRVRCVTA